MPSSREVPAPAPPAQLRAPAPTEATPEHERRDPRPRRRRRRRASPRAPRRRSAAPPRTRAPSGARRARAIGESRRSAITRGPARGELLVVLELEVGLEDERQRRDRRVDRALQPPHVRPLRLHALVHRPSAARDRAVGRGRAQLGHVARRRSAPATSRSCTIASSPRPTASRSRRSSSIVSLTGISSGSATRHVAGARGVGEHLGHLVGLAADRPDAGDLAERPRRREHPDPVAGGGRVDDHEVVEPVAGVPALLLGELPHLRDRDQLLRARRGGDEVLERVRVPEHLAARCRRPAWPATPRAPPAGRS